MKNPQTLVMATSLAAAVIMLVGKLTAFFISGSMAILSDAAESIVHGLATGFAAFSLWYSSLPADENHPYGHGRIAFFSAGFEGGLVLTAAIAVLLSGVVGLVQGVHLRQLGVGLAISVVLAVINLVLGFSLVYVGKQHRSLILIANGKHVLADVWTTCAAIVGVALVMATGIDWLDPLAAILIGGIIMLSGIALIRNAFAGLMDTVDAQTSSRLIRSLKESIAEGLITDFHQLRCREVNRDLWVEVHVLLGEEITVAEAHRRVTEAERRIRAAFGASQVHITTHIEPDDHEAAHPAGHGGHEDPLTPGK